MNERTRAEIELLNQERIALLGNLKTNPNGLEWCLDHTEIADRVVRLVFSGIQESRKSMPALSIVATGGYGRREMAPFSDIDLTVIPQERLHPDLDSLIRELFHDLHTAFGTILRMDVGYAYALINDASGFDAKTRTGFLDSRLVAGSKEPYDSLMALYWDSFAVGEFLLNKLKERDSALAKRHASALVVEPDLKEGAGGVRSFQCANWIRVAIGEMPSRHSRAYDQILRARNLLHLVCGKKQDLLTRQRQAEIAEAINVDMYSWMSSVVEAGQELHREFIRARERLQEARFALSEGVYAIRGEVRISGSTKLSEAAAGIAVATQLGIQVSDLRAGATPGIEGPEILYALGAGEPTLRNLDRCGLLERILPDLTRCRYMLPSDTSHQFTVFEHTMRVVRFIDQIEPSTFLGELKDSLHDPEALYLAALLHDVGKHESEPDHPEISEKIARQVCQRWQTAQEIAELVAWLVRNHLVMSIFTKMRDVFDPNTAVEFANIVQSQDRLDMLTILTYADTRAVAEEAWTPAQMSFLKELHSRTSALIQGQASQEPDPAQYRRRLMRELKHESVSDAEIEQFLKSLQTHYLFGTPIELVKLHMAFEKKAREGVPTVEVFQAPELGVTDLTVCCLDEPGLLSKILGVIYALDLSVHSIRASTTQTETPVALDTISVSFGGKTVPHATTRQLSASLVKVLSKELDVSELLRQRGKDPDRDQKFYQFAYHEGCPGIIEFRTPRGRGMAYRLSRLIAKQGWNIVSARVGQWAGRGAAAFYITGPGDRQLKSDEVNEALKREV